MGPSGPGVARRETPRQHRLYLPYQAPKMPPLTVQICVTLLW